MVVAFPHLSIHTGVSNSHFYDTNLSLKLCSIHCVFSLLQQQQVMAFVKQQQTLLAQQKTEHDTALRQGRELQIQKQQVDAALQQNSMIMSQNKVCE